MNWFSIDQAGLGALAFRRSRFCALAELISNGWDSGTDRLRVEIRRLPDSPYAYFEVEDWGEGFADLNDAYTLFSRSRRAADPAKRGRFSLGEKLALAQCRSAMIRTTTGTVEFDKTGRNRTPAKREQGTLVAGELRCTNADLEDIEEQMENLLPPVPTTFNGAAVAGHPKLLEFTMRLPTEVRGDDDVLRKLRRQTTVVVHRWADGCGRSLDGGHDGLLLEMGIPVVETFNGYLVNVLQKIPLNMERDNVTPHYLRELEAVLLNHVHGHLTEESAHAPWVQGAITSPAISAEAIKAAVSKRFGDRAVSFTPGDPLANLAAQQAGFTVVPGGALPAEAWANIRKHEAVLPSGKVFPSPTPEQLAEQMGSVAAALEQSPICPACGQVKPGSAPPDKERR